MRSTNMLVQRVIQGMRSTNMLVQRVIQGMRSTNMLVQCVIQGMRSTNMLVQRVIQGMHSTNMLVQRVIQGMHSTNMLVQRVIQGMHSTNMLVQRVIQGMHSTNMLVQRVIQGMHSTNMLVQRVIQGMHSTNMLVQRVIQGMHSTNMLVQRVIQGMRSTNMLVQCVIQGMRSTNMLVQRVIKGMHSTNMLVQCVIQGMHSTNMLVQRVIQGMRSTNMLVQCVIQGMHSTNMLVQCGIQGMHSTNMLVQRVIQGMRSTNMLVQCVIQGMHSTNMLVQCGIQGMHSTNMLVQRVIQGHAAWIYKVRLFIHANKNSVAHQEKTSTIDNLKPQVTAPVVRLWKVHVKLSLIFPLPYEEAPVRYVVLQSRLKEKGLRSSQLKQELDLLQTVSVCESLDWAKCASLELLQTALAWQADIEAALEQCGVNVKIADDTPGAHILRLYGEREEAVRDQAELRGRLSSLQEKHQVDIEAALANLRKELQNRASDDAEMAGRENEEKTKRMIAEAEAAEAEKRQAAVEENEAKVIELQANIETLRASILEKEEEQKENKDLARDALEQLEAAKKTEVELQEKLRAAEAKEAEVEVSAVRVREEMMRGYEDETQKLREQVKQHSLTICAMEERLNKVVKKNKEAQTEMNHLKKTIQELKLKLQKPTPPPKPKVILQRPAVDVAATEQLISQLRMENVELQKNLHEQQTTILALRRDLAGASARLTDMAGELSEAQKEEMERNQRRVAKQEAELTSLRQQLAKLSSIVDKQTTEVGSLNGDITKHKSALSKYKTGVTERDSRIKDLETKLASKEVESQTQLNLIEEEGRITSELSALGAQCRGERHDQVIARQREALTELRARIKALEQTRPSLPTHNQALQQVMLLKKELSELHASQSANDIRLQNFCAAVDFGGSETPGGTMSVRRSGDSARAAAFHDQVNRARGVQPQSRAEAEIERSAHRETMEALETSESTFLTLLRGVASALELDSIEGLRSMAHIPKDEREKLMCAREQGCELVTGRIKVLKERIARKDELLQGYEKDLAKLRQAETLANKKTSQVDSLTTDVRSKIEEMQYLREALQRTRTRLEQEKRLNAAIKQKKTFHLENDRACQNSWHKHHCPPEDVMGKDMAKKRVQKEKLKRKNYEIHTLKGELGMKDRDLQNTRRKLLSMESTLGMDDSGRDPLQRPFTEE
ncbi:hypothetical protein LSAT2_005102 [Lamellibrachia satsuma]|nr:hypothetical protein LSAT2_005102 [Lamellibrachia satsuma]